MGFLTVPHSPAVPAKESNFRDRSAAVLMGRQNGMIPDAAHQHTYPDASRAEPMVEPLTKPRKLVP